uniref:Uncharacterized protein n=1 Tax=Human betaherpesvirus 6 TaxID=10368 RepID=A0A5P9VHI4_9BETA|nr:hypothetical protein [Human betaherpesvirus 6]
MHVNFSRFWIFVMLRFAMCIFMMSSMFIFLFFTQIRCMLKNVDMDHLTMLKKFMNKLLPSLFS